MRQRILETLRVVIELALWEYIDQLRPVRDEFAARFGPWSYFGIVWDAKQQIWGPWVAAHTRDHDDLMTRVNAFTETSYERVDHDLLASFGSVQWWDPDNPMMRAFYSLIQLDGLNLAVTKENIVHGILMPQAYILTSRRLKRDEALGDAQRQEEQDRPAEG